jgi:DNA-binding SARP family transcriptional activator
MGRRIEFGLLGPLFVCCDGADVPVPRGKQRALLSVLLLNAGHVVPVSRLAEVLWGAEPPPSAEVSIQNYVKRLRQVLGAAGRERIRTRRPGYLMLVAEDELDVCRFEALLQAARSSARDGSWNESARQARAALALWRGEPLADARSDALAVGEVPRLAELRTQAVETRLEADLHLGRHAEVIAELKRLTAAHPLREHLHSLLMLALYRDGRQGEALEAHQHARDIVIAELGIEPGAELRDLHQRILCADPALADPVTARPTAAESRRVAPRELPPAVPGFTGRTAELAALTQVLDHTDAAAPGTVGICAISGTAGVGKTALALYWAHQVADRFPDGHLHVNLRGFAPTGDPVTAAKAIRGFLDAMGIPPERIPPAPQAQAGLYRRLLADRKMLIVADNARDEEHVRPLLPASQASLVIVTSRNQLSGLAAADGARLLNLDVLARGEAVQLLSARLGAGRAAAEPGALDQIAALCAHLPLALAVTAARAASRPRFPLTELAAELINTASCLDVLDTGDPAVSVAAVFSLSYRQLSPAAARLFRLLGLHPGPDISIPAAASLAGTDRAEADRLLRDLARDCLITEHAPGRYAFHDLLRVYAASQARDCDTQPQRDAAITRVLDHYLHTASHSATLLYPSSEQLALAPPSPGTCPERPASHLQALAWFEAEHHVLLAAATLAAGSGAGAHAWQLPCALAPYLHRRGYPHEQATLTGSGLTAATHGDDPLGQAMTLRYLGNACISTGSYDQARAHLEHCLELYQRLDDRMGQAAALRSLAALADAQGRYADTLGHSEEALRLLQVTGHQVAEAEMLNNVGWCHALLGDYRQAREFCEQSLALIAKLGACDFEHVVWDTLGYTELHLGNHARAAAHFEFALRLCQDYGYRFAEAQILSHIGDARHAADELPQARQAWQQALAIYDDIQHPAVGEVRTKLASTED